MKHARWDRSFVIPFFQAVTLLVAVAGCGRAPRDVADRMTMYSIQGEEDPIPGGDGERFLGYPMLGQLEITDEADRRHIMTAVAESMARAKDPPARCFWPRHAIRVVRRGNTIDYLICFQCHQVSVRREDGTAEMRLINRDAQALLNQYFTDANIPLAPEPQD